MDRLIGKESWVFDLDNTLYPAACNLFAQIDDRMTDFVASYLGLSKPDARAVQKKYYLEHGTTLKGLMRDHGMHPDAFLDYVHDIDLSVLPHMPELRAAITALPGRKFIFSNGSRGHADRVHTQLGLEGIFDGVFGIEDAELHPKPHPLSFDRFVRAHEVSPQEAVMFEDLSRNLKTADDLGFTTVLVTSEVEWSHEPESGDLSNGIDQPDHVHYVTDCLTTFLDAVPGRLDMLGPKKVDNS